MKLLTLLHSLDRTGATLALFHVLSELSTIRPSIISINDGALRAEADRKGWPVIRVARQPSLPWPLDRALSRWQIKRMCRKTPDAIYINTVVAYRLLKWFELPQVPIILHVHELDSYLDEAIAEYPNIFTRADQVIAVSQAVAKTLIRRYNVDAAKIAVIHPITHKVFYDQNDLLDTDVPLRVGGCGSGDLRKGHTLWVLAAAQIAKHMGDQGCRFTWIGGGRDTIAQMKSLARKVGIESVTDFVASTDYPRPLLRQCRVFMHCAWEDPCPLVVTESMLCGVPVCCFADGGGAKEQIGDTGISLPYFSVDAIADAVVSLLRDSNRAKRLGDAARARALELLSPTQTAPQLFQAIEKGINSFRQNVGRS